MAGSHPSIETEDDQNGSMLTTTTVAVATKKPRKMTEVFKSSSLDSISNQQQKSTESTDSTQQQQMSIVTTTTTTIASIGEHFEVQYARFFNTPSFAAGTRHHPSLILPLLLLRFWDCSLLPLITPILLARLSSKFLSTIESLWVIIWSEIETFIIAIEIRILSF